MSRFIFTLRGERRGNRLVSNSSVLNNIQPLLHLGYFPEGAGEHYVSLNVTNLPPELHDYNSDSSFDNGGDFDTINPDSSDVDDENISNETYLATDGQPMGIDADQTDAYSDSDTIIYSLDNAEREQETEQSLPLLPPLVLQQIFQHCLDDDPLSVFTLKQVCHTFSEMLKGAYPKGYISPQIMDVVPNVLSVRKLIRVAGKSSGLILNIKSIFQKKKKKQIGQTRGCP